MKKEETSISPIILLLVIFLMGFLAARVWFPREITEQRLKKDCENMGGKLDIGYDGFFPMQSDYLTFRCVKAQEILFLK